MRTTEAGATADSASGASIAAATRAAAPSASGPAGLEQIDLAARLRQRHREQAAHEPGAEDGGGAERKGGGMFIGATRHEVPAPWA